MGLNIFRLQGSRPIMTINRRRNYVYNGVEYPGPEPPPAAQGETFSWNNLITQLGSSISSIFGGLAGMKQAEAQQQYNQYQTKNTSGWIWIGLAVVVVIVIVAIVLTRKK